MRRTRGQRRKYRPYAFTSMAERELLDGFPRLAAYLTRMYARPAAAPRIAQAFATLKR